MATNHAPNGITQERLFTRRDLSGRWQCSIETLKRRERAGILKPLKLGHTVRYQLDNILAVEQQAIATAA